MRPKRVQKRRDEIMGPRTVMWNSKPLPGPSIGYLMKGVEAKRELDGSKQNLSFRGSSS